MTLGLLRSVPSCAGLVIMRMVIAESLHSRKSGGGEKGYTSVSVTVVDATTSPAHREMGVYRPRFSRRYSHGRRSCAHYAYGHRVGKLSVLLLLLLSLVNPLNSSHHRVQHTAGLLSRPLCLLAADSLVRCQQEQFFKRTKSI